MSTMSITRGDTCNFNVTVKDEDGVIFDLTGYTMDFTAKNDIGDSDSEAVISSEATISSPTSGIGVISLTPDDTTVNAQQYRYDIQISDGGNNVYTVIKNSLLEITDEITQNK